MIQQTQSVCGECRGEGEVIPAKDRCKACNAKKIVKSESVLEVHVDKGMRDGQKITFSGEGDQEPGIPPGDVVIVLDEQEHPVFTRKSQHLIVRLELELVEALCGCAKSIETLDKRHLVFHLLPGEVIKQSDLKVIPGEGMPQYKNPFEKGNLIIQFVVHFPIPNFLSSKKLHELEKLLPAKEEPLIPDECETKVLQEITPEQARHHPYGGGDDDEEDGGPQAVRCQAQ